LNDPPGQHHVRVNGRGFVFSAYHRCSLFSLPCAQRADGSDQFWPPIQT
jgi:hypothetical protein